MVTIIFSVISACKKPADEEIPRLIKQLKSRDSHQRNIAAHELASYGEDAAQAVGPLIGLLHDENPGVQSSAAYALRKIDTPEAKRALEKPKK